MEMVPLSIYVQPQDGIICISSPCSGYLNIFPSMQCGETSTAKKSEAFSRILYLSIHQEVKHRKFKAFSQSAKVRSEVEVRKEP